MKVVKRKLAMLRHAIGILASLKTQEEQTALLKKMTAHIEPPAYLKFDVKDGPRLPYFARHFKSWLTNIRFQDASSISITLYRVLNDCFPGHVALYWEPDDFPDAPLFTAPDPGAPEVGIQEFYAGSEKDFTPTVTSVFRVESIKGKAPSPRVTSNAAS
eukprot:TRINITY_DN24399_c0_g1_i1.p1 TRINITY_DN24399_c0_g1~~TRINITY_DN24399_c0_g1_i1.p1  ORF type:complete len:159 (+),score=17.12 TRINITY_DN24399_c0_g1_i1:374-850(+)